MTIGSGVSEGAEVEFSTFPLTCVIVLKHSGTTVPACDRSLKITSLSALAQPSADSQTWPGFWLGGSGGKGFIPSRSLNQDIVAKAVYIVRTVIFVFAWIFSSANWGHMTPWTLLGYGHVLMPAVLSKYYVNERFVNEWINRYSVHIVVAGLYRKNENESFWWIYIRRTHRIRRSCTAR